MATSIATLNVKLTASIGAFASRMSAATKPLREFGGHVTSIGAKVAAFGGAVTALAAGAGLTALVKNSMETIDATAKLSDRLGIATEAMAGLQHAANLSGVSNEQLTGGLEKMLKALGDAATAATGPAAAAFAKLGLDAGALANMAPDQAFAEIAQGLVGIQNPAERAAVAMGIFGKSGQALLPLMLSGKEGIAAAQAEAEKLGLTFSRVDAAKVEAANDAMTRLQAVFVGAAQTLAIQLAPFIEATAAKLTALGTSGEAVGSKVVAAFEWVLKAVAYGANVFDGFRIVLKSLQLGFAWLFQKAMESARGLATGLAWVVNKSIEAVNWLIQKANKLPGVDINLIDAEVVTDFTTLDAMIEGQSDLINELKGEISDLSRFDNADRVTEFFDGLRQSATENATAVAENAAKMRGAAFDAEDYAAKLKEAQQNAQRVTDTLGDLEKQVTQFGLADAAKKLLDLEAMGASPEQMARARELLTLQDKLTALNGIDTGDPLTDFAAKMEALQKLYAAGQVTAQQFAAIRDDANATLNGKLAEQARSVIESVRTPLETYQQELDRLGVLLDRGLITQETFDRAAAKARQSLESAGGSAELAAPSVLRSGSAEALRFAYDSTRGAQRMSRDELPKKQLATTEETNRILSRIERTGLTASGADAEVVDL